MTSSNTKLTETEDVVRTPMGSADHPRRRVEQHLGVRFPRLLNVFARRIWRLPPGKLRRTLVGRNVRMAWEAFNRRDLDAAFMIYHPDCESVFPDELRTVGFSVPGTDNREDRIRVQREGFTDWGGSLHFEPEELIEAGDRLLTAGRMQATGPGSGAAVDMEWIAVVTMRDGRAIREEIFFDRQRALDAAGAPE
jgi:ketosteroid isomerase-like protein